MVASDYPDKFGVPRQPGLVTAARGVLSLIAPYDDPLAVEGIAAYSHLWLCFVFDRSPETWHARVRPPRLGGNTRIGVFATRSTHRPNRLGLSLVRLLDVATFSRPACAPWTVPGAAAARAARAHLLIGGHDLVDGTPVVDIKPYLPWAEAPDETRADLAPGAPPTLDVYFTDAASRVLDGRPGGAALKTLIGEVLAQDPRPAYRKDDADRRYGMALRDVDVRFVVDETGATTIVRVLSIHSRAAGDQPPI
ncbi:tRNA (N6-threonylcarbamoyladenosine(37)-N6)-methyltransferase TrmO [Salinisphaera sp.]|uniref:tRNA (N6-threonylcarbamoyladenosine(37)-N6)-methyltransferase TrmO n=1 Tax=Salinisphaera sp. TaxID=1914330 RepID=UPI002D765163|nr:tRNA (N6-threonylcarbamoyladenosine(37)-N6)-methyltransferase TrmO [Salinisphaera sp.]HET7313432.1 tRNA (N6-threonylcarbamoyladenosine(37)-N6)-methyltransferase TrmO [Salinisphaera sp.]